MRIYTGRNHLLAPAMIEILKQTIHDDVDAHIVVVPKQLTLQTERTLLAALNLRGSFQLQVYSPERLCGRIFDAAGQPEGTRIDERGRVMLVRTAIHTVADQLALYHDANHRRGFADRCARQLELIRQAGLSPEQLAACAAETSGLLAMKLTDLSIIQREYENLIEGRFQDGESEFIHAVARAHAADFLKRADIHFFGFDITPPTLHDLIVAVDAVSTRTSVFLPLENNPESRDFDPFLPLQNSFERLYHAAKLAGVPVDRICVEADSSAANPLPEPAMARMRSARSINIMYLPAPPQHGELARLERELFAFPTEPDPSATAPRHVQIATLRTPREECLFAAALCRRMAMQRGWHWNEMLILCRDIEAYHQPLKEAFRAYDVPIFLSSSRAAARHALAECLISALRLIDASPHAEDVLSLMRTGFMPITDDEADRLANHFTKYGLRPKAILRPFKRGNEAELQALEPVRERFSKPLNDLRARLKRAKELSAQLAALFNFLTDIGAAEQLQAQLNRLIEADLREQAGEESQVWNRIMGTLDQMAALMGTKKLSIRDLRETLSESLEAAIIKPLPQSDDAVYAQTTERITAQRARAILILGVTDRAGADEDGLLSPTQRQTLSRFSHAYVGADDAELSRMRRFYMKSALGMVSDYLCITCPMSGMDNAAQHPGALIDLVRGIFPKLPMRGGITEDANVQWMLRSSPNAAMAHAARALSTQAEGIPVSSVDQAALAGLKQISADLPQLDDALSRVRTALYHGESAEQLNPRTARALYGEIRRQSITRLERFVQCPFAYFTQFGLRPEKIEPFQLNARDEGNFFHSAVHEFMLDSMDDLNVLSAEAAGERMDSISDRLLDAMTAEGPLGNSSVEMAERRRLKATAHTCAGVLAEHMHESQFVPTALESNFGTEDGMARLTVNASTGECILEGRIDRIDEWVEGGYLRVIDYKRGGRDPELDAVYYGLSLQLPVYLAAAMKKHGENSAGVYYFNLDEGILTLQSTDKYEVEKKRRSQFRLSGIAPDDMDVLRALSPKFSEVMNVRTTKDGALYKGVLATDASGFRVLMERTLKMAGKNLDAIRNGISEIAPAHFKQRDPCKYCDWHSICLFDARMDAKCVRQFKPIKPEIVLEMLKKEQHADE